MVKTLIETGCDPLLTDGEGHNALHYVAAHNLTEFSSVIYSSLLFRHKHIYKNENSSNRTQEIELSLLSHKDYEGMTPIHIATQHGVVLMIELLYPNQSISESELVESLTVLTGKSKSSVLHLAVTTGNAMLVEHISQLSQSFGDQGLINLQDGYGNTALHLAVASGVLECVEILLSYGSYVDVSNDESDLPIDYSISNEISSLL
ncbi:Serine/threonine-protein phosphatase 6 regulatory ankyrin repeat subunit A [Oopsacas minuta]|uniref:Serine/threonine-protein phosphatase 6 regulatory ankyrin repeat subunit A n=1 Tax=Oopsacas minuta TaxID=111878 RepID=A0AAV7JFW8_9METZ|nr:Serine/threonine-protein phosphatase 6 regulatory ankyrin repeat subunit A [Oopsacas minuta]